MLQAGFSEIDITPPLGTLKIGWLKRIVSEEILAPLIRPDCYFQERCRTGCLCATGYALHCLDRSRGNPEWVWKMRMVSQVTHVMVSATHNHAGPAVAQAGDVPKDDTYAADLVTKVITAFGSALDNLQDVEVGFNHVFEWHVAYNRRVVMRDGTVRTHGTFDDPECALSSKAPLILKWQCWLSAICITGYWACW